MSRAAREAIWAREKADRERNGPPKTTTTIRYDGVVVSARPRPKRTRPPVYTLTGRAPDAEPCALCGKPVSFIYGTFRQTPRHKSASGAWCRGVRWKAGGMEQA